MPLNHPPPNALPDAGRSLRREARAPFLLCSVRALRCGLVPRRGLLFGCHGQLVCPGSPPARHCRTSGHRHPTDKSVRDAALDPRTRQAGFTLIELLVVISIISLLISILMPSLSRARDQAKSVHCLARLKEFGNGLATYENDSFGALPPALWYPNEADLDDPITPPSDPDRRVEYGWAELLFAHVYGEQVRVPVSYPVQRNIEGRRWQEYFLCRAVGDKGVSSGHYRVYLPSWGAGGGVLGPGGVYGDSLHASPIRSAPRERIRPKMPLIGDANERSERGDGFGADDCSYIDAGEANYAGSDGGSNGNRFSDRHYGGTNYLFADLHGAWNTHLREELARDYDLNGTVDLTVQTQP